MRASVRAQSELSECPCLWCAIPTPGRASAESETGMSTIATYELLSAIATYELLSAIATYELSSAVATYERV